jgi:hypothetical protein
MTIFFPNNENIWKLSDPIIPTMYIPGNNHEFERLQIFKVIWNNKYN